MAAPHPPYYKLQVVWHVHYNGNGTLHIDFLTGSTTVPRDSVKIRHRMAAIHPVHEFRTLYFGVVGCATKITLNIIQEIYDVNGGAQREMDLLRIRLHPVLQMLTELCGDSSKPNIV